jgi:hypothetical protein
MARHVGATPMGLAKLTFSVWRNGQWVTWHDKVKTRSDVPVGVCTRHNLLDKLVRKYDDLFAVPRAFRPCGHQIHLVHGAKPVVVWPYRYPAIQKDEL